MMTQSRKRKISRRAYRLSLAVSRMLRDLAADKIPGDLPGQPLADLLAANRDIANQVLTLGTSEPRREMLVDFANMRDDGANWFRMRWGHRTMLVADDVLELRDELRTIWKKPPTDYVDNVLNKWFAWRPGVKEWDPRELGSYMPFECSIDAAELVPMGGTFHGDLIQGVFENWPFFKYCASLNCAAPYFIAKRKDQTVCNAEACKAEKQRQHALKWWHEHRAKESKSKSKQNRKGP